MFFAAGKFPFRKQSMPFSDILSSGVIENVFYHQKRKKAINYLESNLEPLMLGNRIRLRAGSLHANIDLVKNGIDRLRKGNQLRRAIPAPRDLQSQPLAVGTLDNLLCCTRSPFQGYKHSAIFNQISKYERFSTL